VASVVTASELRSVLGVTSALYSDAVLTDILDTAEQIIGPMLVQWSSPIDKHKSESATLTTIHTTTQHKFYAGQTVAISGVEAHVNGNKTIVDILDEYTFTITTSGAPIHTDFRNNIPAGIAAENDLTQYDNVSAVESAILAISVDIFQSRIAPGGTQQALDYVPGPYRMGRSLMNRVIGLLGPYLDVESVIG
jgi:hypothetical protein